MYQTHDVVLSFPPYYFSVIVSFIVEISLLSLFLLLFSPISNISSALAFVWMNTFDLLCLTVFAEMKSSLSPSVLQYTWTMFMLSSWTPLPCRPVPASSPHLIGSLVMSLVPLLPPCLSPVFSYGCLPFVWIKSFSFKILKAEHTHFIPSDFSLFMNTCTKPKTLQISIA